MEKPFEIITFTDHPLDVLLISLAVMWISAWIGRVVRRKSQMLDDISRQDFSIILAAALTLLGLTIGFTFSMAASRYDQRKNYEESEANAIGTEYLRADLLPAADGAKARSLLKDYLDQRILFYSAVDESDLTRINARTSQLQTQLWASVLPAAEAQPNSPIIALTVSGMNDVLNSQGYTQSAWWYRIPRAAWHLMMITAICCNVLIGYGSRGVPAGAKLLLILPIIIAIAFTLIADIDSPRAGVIRVKPQNLMSLADSLRSQ